VDLFMADNYFVLYPYRNEEYIDGGINVSESAKTTGTITSQEDHKRRHEAVRRYSFGSTTSPEIRAIVDASPELRQLLARSTMFDNP
jgi:hypothetical protein